MIEILKLLEDNAKISSERLAAITDIAEIELQNKIKEYEDNGTIVGYTALIDWDKTSRECVSAIIEIKVTPQKDMGFDKVAKSICKHSEVRSVYLMSGGFDLLCTVEGKNMKEVAMFVSERLATLEGVTATATHFVLKKYKDKGVNFYPDDIDERGFTLI